MININVVQEEIAEYLRLGAALRLATIETNMTAIAHAAELIINCLQCGGKLLFFGNGGSAADSQHLAAEFVGRFIKDRPPLAAVALTTDTSAITAIANDCGFENIFARQVMAVGCAGDIAIAISTSGKSPNIILGVEAARQKGIATIGLTGNDGGKLSNLVDCAIVIPSTNTAHIQEMHITIGHILCGIAEQALLLSPSLFQKN